MNNSTIDCALSYANRGWSVIPLHSIQNGKCTCRRDCKKPGKHPIISNWQGKATTVPSVIRQTFKKYPFANIGITTGQQSGLVVIDIDPRNGGDASLQNLIDSYPDFKAILGTYEVKTGGSGSHYYYTHSEAFKSLKKHGLEAGIDIKADGGYILTPPSNHISGGSYSVVNDIEPLALPKMLIDLIQHIDDPKIEAEIVSEGSRNNWLAEQAGTQLRAGKTPKQVETFLLEQNALCCKPPLEFLEVVSIVRSMGAGFKPELQQKSIKTQWQELILESGFGGNFALVLLGLSLWMDSEGRNCWPTEEQMEERFHVTRKTIRKNIAIAEQAGYLSRYTRSHEGKRGFSYGYIARLPLI